jgi:hypothetical protein
MGRTAFGALACVASAAWALLLGFLKGLHDNKREPEMSGSLLPMLLLMAYYLVLPTRTIAAGIRAGTVNFFEIQTLDIRRTGHNPIAWAVHGFDPRDLCGTTNLIFTQCRATRAYERAVTGRG